MDSVAAAGEPWGWMLCLTDPWLWPLNCTTVLCVSGFSLAMYVGHAWEAAWSLFCSPLPVRWINQGRNGLLELFNPQAAVAAVNKEDSWEISLFPLWLCQSPACQPSTSISASVRLSKNKILWSGFAVPAAAGPRALSSKSNPN